MKSSIPEMPVYGVINGNIARDRCSVSVMYRGSRFDISVSREDLIGSKHELEYTQLVERMNGSRSQSDDEAYDVFCKWITSPCADRFLELAPVAPITDITLQAFYYPPSYALKLFNSSGHLCVGSTSMPSRYSDDLMVPTKDIPSYQQVHRLKATELWITSNDASKHGVGSEIPHSVRTVDGTIRFFKPGFRRNQFRREMEIQTKISGAGLRGKIRVSNLHGIVVSEDTEMIIGSVFDLIPSRTLNFESTIHIQAHQFHKRWETQVRDVIEQLHAHDIIWGDVHPGNIVIDINFNAWIVDFGGGCVEEFIDRENYETEKGDWQGFSNIFHHWIPRQKVNCKLPHNPIYKPLFKGHRHVDSELN